MYRFLRCIQKLAPSSAQKFTSKNIASQRFYSDAVECPEDKMDYIPHAYNVKLPPRSEKRNKQNFDYFLILDFESTCDAPKNLIPQEIIEFPVLKVNGETLETESIFHSYVKPMINPELTKFCTRLTGITQEMVENQPTFEDVYEDFQYWMHKEEILKEGTTFAFVTCGNWDFKIMFPIQCKGMRIEIPDYMKRWINIKYSFESLSGIYPKNMVAMMKYCDLEHVGNLHSGIDDCRNLAKLFKDLADRGYVYDNNSGIHK